MPEIENQAESSPGSRLSQPVPAVLHRLVAIYCSVCRVSDVDVDADLLDLGLRSIDAIRIANLVSEELGGEIAFDEFLREPTLRALSVQLSRKPHAGVIPRPRELAAPGEPADVEEFIL